MIYFYGFLFLCFACFFFFFFFNDTATTEIYTLSLHDALPISSPTCFARSPTGMMLSAIAWHPLASTGPEPGILPRARCGSEKFERRACEIGFRVASPDARACCDCGVRAGGAGAGGRRTALRARRGRARHDGPRGPVLHEPRGLRHQLAARFNTDIGPARHARRMDDHGPWPGRPRL